MSTEEQNNGGPHGRRLGPKKPMVRERMLAILSDGLPHTREELHACLDDELGAISNIQPHITNLRKELPPGQGIVTEYIGGRMHYRCVRFLASPYDGRK